MLRRPPRPTRPDSLLPYPTLFRSVGVGELGRLGGGGTRHAGDLVVHAEVVLEGDRGEGLVLLLDLHALLGLDRLVEALRPAAPLEDAAGELVDDLDRKSTRLNSSP